MLEEKLKEYFCEKNIIITVEKKKVNHRGERKKLLLVNDETKEVLSEIHTFHSKRNTIHVTVDAFLPENMSEIPFTLIELENFIKKWYYHDSIERIRLMNSLIEFEMKTKMYSISYEKLDGPIENWDFSTRTLNCLKRQMFNNIRMITYLNELQLASIHGMGKKSVDEVIEKLKEAGIQLEKW